MADADPIIGIDLGTTNSLAAYMDLAGLRALRDSAGAAIIPSVVCLAGTEPLVGAAAIEAGRANPRETVYSVKRLIGKSLAEIRAQSAHLPYELLQDGGIVKVRVRGRDYTPQEISALILRAVKARAEAALGVSVRRAVITVPAYFDDTQRQATRDAGRIAGLEVLRIINEPTAASLAYGLDRKRQGTVVVYDLGGGTFDVSVLKIEDGVFRVLATAGDTALGGDDFDRLIQNRMLEAVRRQTGVDAAADAAALYALKLSAEQSKISLSVRDHVEWRQTVAGRECQGSLDRAAFEAMIAPWIERSLQYCARALADAGVEAAAVDDVVLVGGSTRVPLVRAMVERYFGRRPHMDLNPDEVVALGAAVQGWILAGGTRDILLMDVTPLSLGIETVGGAFSKIIMRNSPVPTRVSEEFSTSVDNQTAVDIHVLQGEREMVADCRPLGRFKLRGLPPMPAGFPRIEVNFALDANGILTVRALEKRTNTEAGIQVVPTHGLTREQVDVIVEDSIRHAMDDFTLRKRVELKNKARAMLGATERGLPRAEAGKLVPEAELARIRALTDEVKALLAAEHADVDRFEAALDDYGKATEKLAEELMNSAVTGALRGKTMKDLSGGAS